MYLTPAQFVINRFNGIRPLARAVNRQPSTVHSWKVRGTIPTDMQAIILTIAIKKNLDIRPQDLVVGRKISA
jgi:hypothetical protein